MSSQEVAKTVKMTKECVFCGLDIEDKLQLGDLLHCNDLYVHYYCMLLSSALEQRGKSDNDGILGFLPEDIMGEVRRGKRLRCYYCKKTGATLGCYSKRCKKAFHLPCGLKNGTLHQYFGNFPSYCAYHRPKQVLFSDAKQSSVCPICLNSVENHVTNHTLYSPCCKNGWFHRSCIQRQALSTGYFFRCPLCNNLDCFQEEMHLYGIYIPEQDAAWELEQNAYEDLLFHYCRCDALACKCPEGRQHNKDKSCWEVIVCNMCGSQGCHAACANLSYFDEWQCETCTEINKINSIVPAETSKTNIPDKKKRVSSRKGFPSCRDVKDVIIRVDRIDSLHHIPFVKDTGLDSTSTFENINHKQFSSEKVTASLRVKAEVLHSNVNEMLQENPERFPLKNITTDQGNNVRPPYVHIITTHPHFNNKTVSDINVPDITEEYQKDSKESSEKCPTSSSQKKVSVKRNTKSPQTDTVIEEKSMKQHHKTKDAPLPKRHCSDISMHQNGLDQVPASKLHEVGHSGPCIKTLLKQPCDLCSRDDHGKISLYHIAPASMVQHSKSERNLSLKPLQNCKSLTRSPDIRSLKSNVLSCHNSSVDKSPGEKKHKKGRCTPLHCSCKNTPYADKTLRMKALKGNNFLMKRHVKCSPNEEKGEIDKLQKGVVSEKIQVSLLQLFQRMKSPIV